MVSPKLLAKRITLVSNQRTFRFPKEIHLQFQSTRTGSRMCHHCDPSANLESSHCNSESQHTFLPTSSTLFSFVIHERLQSMSATFPTGLESHLSARCDSSRSSIVVDSSCLRCNQDSGGGDITPCLRLRHPQCSYPLSFGSTCRLLILAISILSSGSPPMTSRHLPLDRGDHLPRSVNGRQVGQISVIPRQSCFLEAS
jgi:hypothetical protein